MPSDLLGAHLDRWTPVMERQAQWVATMLERFTYKPGWHFGMTRQPSVGAVGVSMQFLAQDSTRGPLPPRYGEVRMCADGMVEVERTDMVPIYATYFVPNHLEPGHDEHRFWEWLRGRIGEVEMHERDEWFRVDKALPYDPHRGGL